MPAVTVGTERARSLDTAIGVVLVGTSARASRTPGAKPAPV
jgi:hypothetical protein